MFLLSSANQYNDVAQYHLFIIYLSIFRVIYADNSVCMPKHKAITVLADFTVFLVFIVFRITLFLLRCRLSIVLYILVRIATKMSETCFEIDNTIAFILNWKQLSHSSYRDFPKPNSSDKLKMLYLIASDILHTVIWRSLKTIL